MEKETLRYRLESEGFAIVDSGDVSGFQAVCKSLGNIKRLDEVRIRPNGKNFLSIADAVPLHTDHPLIPIVGWHCIRQDATDGATLLADSRQVLAEMRGDDVRVLEDLRVPTYKMKGIHPLYTRTPQQVYWLPRLIDEAARGFTPAQLQALRQFREKLAEMKSSGRLKRVLLRPGQSLLISNHGMLHGRDEISPGSERHLVRAYVTT